MKGDKAENMHFSHEHVGGGGRRAGFIWTKNSPVNECMIMNLLAFFTGQDLGNLVTL